MNEEQSHYLESVRKNIIVNKNKLFNVADISFKYLFNDKTSEYHGKYFNYELVEGSIIYPSPDMILFKVGNRSINEFSEMKLIYLDSSFYIVSEFLDDKDTKYELKYFKNDTDILFYKNFSDGEMYLHIELV